MTSPWWTDDWWKDKAHAEEVLIGWLHSLNVVNDEIHRKLLTEKNMCVVQRLLHRAIKLHEASEVLVEMIEEYGLWK